MTCLSVGMPSPSDRAIQPTDGGGLQRSQTFGQKIMGNMRDNLFLRSFTSKPKNYPSDAVVPSSPSKVGVQSIVLQVYELLFWRFTRSFLWISKNFTYAYAYTCNFQRYRQQAMDKLIPRIFET